MTQLITIRSAVALIGVAGLTACATPDTSAMGALPSEPSARARSLAEVKDELDALGTPQAAASSAPMNATTAMSATQAAPMSATAAAPGVIAASDPTMITGLGFAQIAGQPGNTLNEKRLLALRAARMDALRDLTEQVHGIHINASTTVGQARIGNDSLSAVVDGTIRGARTVRITPKGTDGYEVELSLDPATVAYIVRAFRGQV